MFLDSSSLAAANVETLDSYAFETLRISNMHPRLLAAVSVRRVSSLCCAFFIPALPASASESGSPPFGNAGRWASLKADLDWTRYHLQALDSPCGLLSSMGLFR